MKRLLAYLFVVLGFNFTFSVNAISATALSEGEGYARILYNKKSEKLNAKKAACKLAKKKAINHALLEAKGNFNFEHIKSERKIFEKIKEFSVQREGKKKLIFGVKLKKKKDKYVSCVYGTQISLNSGSSETQTAKAEPSQTQEVADKHFVQILKIKFESDGIIYWREFNDLNIAANISKSREFCRKREQKRFNYNYNYNTQPRCILKTILVQTSEKKNYFNINDSTNLKKLISKINNSFKSITQIAKIEPSQMSKTYNWFALVKHPKTNEEFIATNVSNEKDAKGIAISKCYKYVTSQLNKRGYNDCYVDLTVDGNKNIQLAKKIISKQNSNNSISLTTNDSFNGDYKWNGKTVSKTVFCSNAVAANMPKYYPEKYILMCKTQTQIATTEPKQEEFKPETGDIDNDAPVIEIAEAITVNDTSYEIEGSVTDKADKIFVEIDGQSVQVKKGKFKIKRYSPVDEQIKIVAIDQWGNKSKPKLVNITINLEETIVADKLEPLNPLNIINKSSNNKIALIIGIENYTEAPKANYANLDAKYFFDYARRAFGVKKQNINLLVNEEATVVKTDKALSLWLKSKIKKNRSDLIIFFAGHGLASSDGKELYLLPQDGNPDRLERTALSRTDLFKEIINLNPKSVTMFLDTCYSGVSRDEQMLLASARPIRIIADEQEGIPDNFTIFSASKLDQISSGLKEVNHGIFSYFLMKGLEGNADSNEDKKITNGELLAYMDENVSQKAAEQGRKQNPSFVGDPDKVLMSYR